jgi:TIR domain-containing protein
MDTFEMGLNLFLSHASEDKEIVRRFGAGLSAPLRVWIDEGELRTGDRFPASLQAAIGEQCDFVVVFLSRPALDSAWVRRELAWALERESQVDASVPYVLPVLLEPLLDAPDYPAALKDRLGLSCFDRSDEGIARVARELSSNLFAWVAAYYASNRPKAGRGLIDQFQAELTAYQDAAYLLCASLADPIGSFTADGEAETTLVQAIERYTASSGKLVGQLSAYTERVKARWGTNLGEDCESLAQFIEKDVYRGQVYALNEIRDAINQFQAGSLSGPALEQEDQRKKDRLVAVRASLGEMTERALKLFAKLRRER